MKIYAFLLLSVGGSGGRGKGGERFLLDASLAGNCTQKVFFKEEKGGETERNRNLSTHEFSTSQV